MIYRLRRVVLRQSLSPCLSRLRLRSTLIQPRRMGDDLRLRSRRVSAVLYASMQSQGEQPGEQSGDYIYKSYPAATRTWWDKDNGVLRAEPIDIYAAT